MFLRLDTCWKESIIDCCSLVFRYFSVLLIFCLTGFWWPLHQLPSTSCSWPISLTVLWQDVVQILAWWVVLYLLWNLLYLFSAIRNFILKGIQGVWDVGYEEQHSLHCPHTSWAVDPVFKDRVNIISFWVQLELGDLAWQYLLNSQAETI